MTLPAGQMMDDAERLAWLRLIRSAHIGPKTFHDLLRLYGSAQKALEHLPDMMRRGGKTQINLYTPAQAEHELTRLEAYGGQLLLAADPAYPETLRQVVDAPPVLTVLGNTALLSQQSVAMVGARNASVNASRLAYSWAGELAKAGYVVVSGLARGIDTAVHKGAGAAHSVAVLAGGIDHIYPKENTTLYRQLAQEGGAIVAECAFGTVPRAENFPRRNRIIAGLTLGTLVVEAAYRSGSLITARFANEQGREVMAVPGFPLDPRAEGGNRLIKQGATLVENPQDVIDAVCAPSYPQQGDWLAEEGEPMFSDVMSESLREKVIAALGAAPVCQDSMIDYVQASAAEVATILLELELAGRLARYPGNKVALVA